MQLELDEYTRYGRQMLVPEIGLTGQLAYKEAKVLVVGAGGLGSPCLPYLAGAGVGFIGIVDDDVVEVSNLHRQVLHSEPGLSKAESAAAFINKLNPNVKVEIFKDRLTTENAFAIAEQFQLVVDCTDNVSTRYLINDVCVLQNKPVVSATALRLEGQLCVYNYLNGPCYRCLYPNPSSPNLSTKCSESGVLGAVVGVLGSLQAAEVLKILLEQARPSLLPKQAETWLTLFSLFKAPQIKQVRVRPKQANCVVCGTNPTIVKLSPENYIFPTCKAPDNSNIQQLNVNDFKNMNKQDITVVDCRAPVEYEICSLPDTVNIPLNKISKLRTREEAAELIPSASLDQPLVILCRRGNDSVSAARILQNFGYNVSNLTGGLVEYSREVDPEFPVY